MEAAQTFVFQRQYYAEYFDETNLGRSSSRSAAAAARRPSTAIDRRSEAAASRVRPRSGAARRCASAQPQPVLWIALAAAAGTATACPDAWAAGMKGSRLGQPRSAGLSGTAGAPPRVYQAALPGQPGAGPLRCAPSQPSRVRARWSRPESGAGPHQEGR